MSSPIDETPTADAALSRASVKLLMAAAAALLAAAVTTIVAQRRRRARAIE